MTDEATKLFSHLGMSYAHTQSHTYRLRNTNVIARKISDFFKMSTTFENQTAI